MAKSRKILTEVTSPNSEYHFPDIYFQYYSKKDANTDISLLKQLKSDGLEISFLKKDDGLHLKLFQLNHLLPLSQIIPELGKMGIDVIDKWSFNFNFGDKSVWLTDFLFQNKCTETKIIDAEKRFKEALIRISHKEIENDIINSLILCTKLNWQEIVLLRAYSKYLQQIGTQFDSNYIGETLAKNFNLSYKLVSYFKEKFDYKKNAKIDAEEKDLKISKIVDDILKIIDGISSPDEDKIMRNFFTLITATSRTNFFHQPSSHTLVLKFQLEKMIYLAPAGPKIDTYIYSMRFEGIHRRSSLIARGGIRWSERADFSLEILSLMRTQIVKNSVIIPTGAKGGFLLKNKAIPRDKLLQEGQECYQEFIAGLLSITDNTINNVTIHPQNLVCYDGDDPYLVVAADKGTANFSDLANAIAKKFNFWLNDAFASGGKTGYNHKEMGITAKGAWEAVIRHFIDLTININTTQFSVIGIGDMSGDVCGNGLLLSKNIKLIAAFDHRHIFIDPNPDPQTSWNERMRLFQLPTSSWEDYNPKLLSKGGGVFSRQVKLVSLNKDIRNVLDIEEESLSPNELIRAILKAPVDLLWNGGIGTFIKASFEDHVQAGDNTNIPIRIDGDELRCRIVGEGGNLGFTQAARIQYALRGGKINTDFIDNMGGVSCSDHEVNIKILLDSLVSQKKLTVLQRNDLLQSMYDDVLSLVLQDANEQSLAISLIEEHSRNHIDQYIVYLNYLEKEKLIKREKEGLPNDDDLLRMKSHRQPLLRPQISILLARTKIMIKEEILLSKLPDMDFCNNFLRDYFPQKTHKKPYLDAIDNHLLKRQIIATTLANDLINRMGITYLYITQQERMIPLEKIIEIYILIRNIFSLDTLQEYIESLNYKIDVMEQYKIFLQVQDLVRNSTHWFLYNENLSSLEKIAKCYKKGMDKLYAVIPTLIVGDIQNYMITLRNQLVAIGMPDQIATRVGDIRALYAGLNIIYISNKYHCDLEITAKVYFYIGEYLEIVWFRDNLFLNKGEFWDNLACTSLRDKFDKQQQKLTKLIINQCQLKADNTTAAFQEWEKTHHTQIEQWKSIVASIKSLKKIELSVFFVATEELEKITNAIENS